VGVILLVRHGQASFGSADYDVLSPLGEQQSRRLGRALADRGTKPAAVISGSMRRQRASAAWLAEEAGWAPPASVDAGWNEYDFGPLVAGRGDGRAPRSPREFQDALEGGLRQWASSGEAPGAETFAAFASRTESAVRAVAEQQPPGATVIIATSGGVISWIAATLLGGGVEQWIRLNRVCVNTGVTKLVTGRRGTSLITFNEHNHLSEDEVSYR
jgi:broad specificity phosphatase PhoE